jgi:2-iminobutanoate/2-iminopropanoate deaminase
MRKEIFSETGAPPKGYYSQAIAAQGTLLFVSGQGAVDPVSGEFRFGSFEEQARLTFENVTALLKAAGTSWSNVIKVSVFLADIANFAEMNQIYQSYAVKPYPARTTVQSGLVPGMEIEVDCIAVIPDER